MDEIDQSVCVGHCRSHEAAGTPAALLLNERLAELEVRAAAVRTDPDCTSTIEEAWGDLYPRIVKQDSSPDATFYPEAIPADRTLVLAAEWYDRRLSNRRGS